MNITNQNLKTKETQFLLTTELLNYTESQRCKDQHFIKINKYINKNGNKNRNNKILDVWVKEDNTASQEVFRWFKYSIEKDYKSIEILSDVKTKKDETEYIRHRLILKYDIGCISAEVIDIIVKDFYPNYNKDGNKIF